METILVEHLAKSGRETFLTYGMLLRSHERWILPTGQTADQRLFDFAPASSNRMDDAIGSSTRNAPEIGVAI